MDACYTLQDKYSFKFISILHEVASRVRYDPIWICARRRQLRPASVRCAHTTDMPPSVFTLYRPSLARQISRRTSRSRFLSTAVTDSEHAPSRPYTFHIGASWAGKPQDPTLAPKVPFPSDTLVGSWRDKTLKHPKSVKSVDAGEDFFFVQQVRSQTGGNLCAPSVGLHG